MPKLFEGIVKKQGGGSAANTMSAFSQLGGKGYYSCKVADDEDGLLLLCDSEVDSVVHHLSDLDKLPARHVEGQDVSRRQVDGPVKVEAGQADPLEYSWVVTKDAFPEDKPAPPTVTTTPRPGRSIQKTNSAESLTDTYW